MILKVTGWPLSSVWKLETPRGGTLITEVNYYIFALERGVRQPSLKGPSLESESEIPAPA